MPASQKLRPRADYVCLGCRKEYSVEAYTTLNAVCPSCGQRIVTFAAAGPPRISLSRLKHPAIQPRYATSPSERNPRPRAWLRNLAYEALKAKGEPLYSHEIMRLIRSKLPPDVGKSPERSLPVGMHRDSRFAQDEFRRYYLVEWERRFEEPRVPKQARANSN